MRIRSIHIENFRGIRNQTIDGITSALVLIGKNNSGKSAVLTAIRAFWGDYAITESDIYKGADSIALYFTFEISEEDLREHFWDAKIGVAKYPSSGGDFSSARVGTLWDATSFSNYKDERDTLLSSNEMHSTANLERFMHVWLNATKSRISWTDGICAIRLNYNRSDQKVTFFAGESPVKDFGALLPDMAFIDDTRNFESEENGKPKSITASLFSIILSQGSPSNELSCRNCDGTNCEVRCISALREKRAADLSSHELEKLITFNMYKNAANTLEQVNNRFEANYRRDFRINFRVSCSMEKAFSISTKIVDPVLDSELDLGNVGAGVRSIYLLSLLQAYQNINGRKAIFLLEEPEIYLHPGLQKEMARTLASIAESNQIVITTHSPLLLNEFHTNDIRKVQMNLVEYQTQIFATTLDDILSEIGYSSQDIINIDFVIFVEGKDDKEVIGGILHKRYNIEHNRVLIIDTKSCKNIGFYATLRFLSMTTLQDSFAIIRDADTMKHEEVQRILTNQLQENSSNYFVPNTSKNLMITKYSSIEGYLFSPELLVRHQLFANEAAVYARLSRFLEQCKEKHIEYYAKHNHTDQDQITQFREVFDHRLSAVKEHIEWFKTNIRGHDYFRAPLKTSNFL